MPMFVLAMAAVIALVFGVLLIAVVIGICQAHPTDLALQRPKYLEALTRRVLGLSVRRNKPQPLADSAVDCERAAR